MKTIFYAVIIGLTLDFLEIMLGLDIALFTALAFIIALILTKK